MSWTVLVPAATGVVLGLVAGRLQRRLQPPHATLAFTLLSATAALAVVAAVVALSLLFVSTSPAVGERLSWCRDLRIEHDLPVWLGVSAVAATIMMCASMRRALRRLHAHHEVFDGQSFLVLPTDEPEAFAVPGDPGCVVVSAGMLRALDGDERRVLLAHEHAHLAQRHHRYLWVSTLAASAVPLLRPLDRRVRFATERWADEDAALAVGDRHLVARALARAALAQDSYRRPAMSLASLGVGARVRALLAEPTPAPRARRVLAPAAAGLSVTAAALLSSVQVHHLATFAMQVCPAS